MKLYDALIIELAKNKAVAAMFLFVFFTAGFLSGWLMFNYIWGSACYQDIMANSIRASPSDSEEGWGSFNRYEFVGHPELVLSPGLVDEYGKTESRLMLDHVFIIHKECE